VKHSDVCMFCTSMPGAKLRHLLTLVCPDPLPMTLGIRALCPGSREHCGGDELIADQDSSGVSHKVEYLDNTQVNSVTANVPGMR
jgi:hypothetical protein